MTTEAVGMMIAVGDYKGDLKAITDVLNSLHMFECSDDREWTVYGNGTIGLHGWTNHSPSVYPWRYTLVFKDGRRYLAHEAERSVHEEWEYEDGEMDCEVYSLEQLSKLISPHLTEGALEIVAMAQEVPVSYEAGIGAYCERLVIRSNGSAEPHHYWARACKRKVWEADETENYDPNTVPRTA
jgi:hypothetical protein